MIFLVLVLLSTNFLPTKNACNWNNTLYKFKLYDDPDYITIYCGVYNQCICREYVNMYATCYDPQICQKFPRTFTTKLTTFKLATTAIVNLTIGDLDNMTNIKTLHIQGNNDLNWIEPGIFRKMSQLTELSISINPKLDYFEENLFEGLINLETLSIKRNGLENIKNFSLSLKSEFMLNLRKLELNEVKCPIIDKDDFMNLNGSQLEELDFIDAQIEYIHPEALLPIRNLRRLLLGQNFINTTNLIDLLNKIIEAEIPLNMLSLIGWGFKKKLPRDLMEVIAKSNITELSLSKNQFDTISEDVFSYMPHLEKLHLFEVFLSSITDDAFVGVPNLSSLYLRRNKFTTIPEAVLLPSLRELDLSKNSIQDEVMDSYFTLEENKLRNMTNLEQLDLSFNNIRNIPKGSFTGLVNLLYLNLQNCNIFNVDEGAFNTLKRLAFLSLESNPFPSRSFTKEIFEGLDNLEELELGFCKITALSESTNTFYHLKSLKRIDLRGNNLKVLSPVVLSPLINLEILNVAKNNLSVWQKRLFANKKMKQLLASENKLTYFSRAMLEDFISLEELDVSRNPFTCECSQIQNFYYFDMSIINKILDLIDYIPSKCVYPDKYSDYLVNNYFEAILKGEECKVNDWHKYIDYIVPAIILLIIIIIVILAAYIYRWHIRYWLFLTKMFLARRAQFNKNLNLQGHDNYVYDAFVSYSSEDRNFVVRLVAMLENYEPFLKLCVYDRDFEIGTIISESVLECVSRSRKTLLVISNSYIKSQWCRWEAQVAENHRLFFENEYGECVNDSIIMIKLGNISQHNLSPMLKYLMKTRIYLQWDSDENKQKQFWEKLRNALAPGPILTISKKIEDFTSVSSKD